MKKVLSILLSALMLISVFSVSGFSASSTETSAVNTDATENTVSYNLDSQTGILTISGSGAMTDYTSASTVPWYSSRTTVTSVVIEEGITHIGAYAFYNCTNLVNVTLPSTVTTIGQRAFYGCKLLSTINLPHNLTSLGERVFQNCSALTEITIPDLVTNIGSYAFNSCKSLTSVYINKIESWLNITFGNATATPLNNSTSVLYAGNQVVTEINIPENITKINDFTFYGYKGLTSISIPETAETIGCSAFYGCTGLTDINIPDGLKYVGEKAFYNCSGIHSISIADSVTYIGTDAFTNTSYYNNTANWTSNILYIGNQLIKANTSLSGAITIRSGTISIAGKAFNNCSKISSVTIPSSVKSMANHAFFGCSSLTAVYINDLASWCDIYFETIASTPVNKANKLYLNNTLITSLKIPEGITKIGDFAFAYCTSITTVTTSKTVTSIGQYAFAYDTALESISFSEGLTEIGQYAFNKCSTLTSISFPETLATVGSYAFASCSAISSVNAESIQSWCNITFGNYSANPVSISQELSVKNKQITEVIIPEGVTAISPSAFYGMISLTKVIIPSTVETIGSYAFYGCSALADVTIEEGTKLIKNYAFKNCTSLSKIILPYSVETIEVDVFYGCSALTTIAIYNAEISIYNTSNTIPDTAEIYSYVNSNAQCYATAHSKKFKDIYNLDFEYTIDDMSNVTITKCISDKKDVFIPYTIEGCVVTTIGANAFENCTNIESVKISGTVTNIETDAFKGCIALSSVKTDSITDWLNIDFANSTSNPLYYAGKLYVSGELFESLTTDETITALKPYAFVGCTSLKTVTISEHTETIGTNAFADCSNIDIFAVYHHETTIGDSIDTIDIGGTIYGYMNSNAHSYALAYGKKFKDLSTLKYSYTLTDNETAIITGYFGNDENLNIPYAIDGYLICEIADKVFSNNTILKSVSVPDCVVTIGEKTFYNCSNLESITLGDSLLTIKNAAFYGCTALTNVNITNMPTWCAIEFKALTSNPLYYAENLYLNEELVTELALAENATKINTYAFWGYTKLTKVSIPDSITEIGKYAFYNCSSIENVYINSLENWCKIKFGNYYSNPVYYAMNLSINNEAVTDLMIPENTETISAYAFANCINLTRVTIPETVTTIGQEAFFGCTSLNAVNTDSIEAWCNISFANSTANPLYYSNSLYVNKQAVTNLEIPINVTSIKDFAFFHCTNLKSVTFDNTIKSIGKYAFHNCTPVVKGYVDSVAEDFATDNNLSFTAFGDVNGDSEVTINDVTDIQKHLVKIIQLDNNSLEKADINDDGRLTIRDATYIQMYVAKYISSFSEII